MILVFIKEKKMFFRFTKKKHFPDPDFFPQQGMVARECHTEYCENFFMNRS